MPNKAKLTDLYSCIARTTKMVFIMLPKTIRETLVFTLFVKIRKELKLWLGMVNKRLKQYM